MTPVEQVYSRHLLVAAKAAGLLATLPTYVGVAVLLFDRETGLALLLGGSLALFVLHLVVGIVGYRAAMRRPWPEVAPLDDEDEW